MSIEIAKARINEAIIYLNKINPNSDSSNNDLIDSALYLINEAMRELDNVPENNEIIE